MADPDAPPHRFFSLSSITCGLGVSSSNTLEQFHCSAQVMVYVFLRFCDVGKRANYRAIKLFRGPGLPSHGWACPLWCVGCPRGMSSWDVLAG